jgi:hypothetical protein
MLERSAFDGGLKRSMQHTEDCVGSRSVAYEAPHENPIYGKSEVPDVGSMAAGRIPSSDCTAVRPIPLIGPGDFGSLGRDSPKAPMSLG